MNQTELKYFLGANSCEGFVSAFADSYDAKAHDRAFIIKGGPGTGKSSFMKYVAARAQDAGVFTELCPCSSDPQSLDAVILPEKKIVIMDGTAPHTVDPVYPGVCETILNFGQFWDSKKFQENPTQVIALTDQNKALHKTASRYLQAAGHLMRDNYDAACACMDREKVLAFARRLCAMIPAHSGTGREWVRFVGGITPQGVVSYPDTLTYTCQRLVIIDDDVSSVSDLIMGCVRQHALKNGYEIITLKNPFLPSMLTDHVVIPALSLGFVTENAYIRFDSDVRRIHASRFTDSGLLRGSRERIAFHKKAIRKLLSSSAETLRRAKEVHDALEKHYIDAMDFDAVSRFAQRFSDEILT